MADNVQVYPGVQGTPFGVAADEGTYSGDANQKAQIVQLGFTTGAEGSRTIDKIPGDATNGIDVDVTRLPAGTNLIGSVAAQLDTSTIRNGAGTALTPKFAAIAAASSGNNTLVAAVASKKIRVLSMFILAAGAVNAYFTSANGGTVIFGGSTNKINLAANGGFVLPFSPVGWFENASTNEALVLNLSAAVAVSGGLVYVEV